MEKNENEHIDEVETNLHRFMQIREEFYNAVQEIKPIVASLKETTKSLVAHFEVLREISKQAEKNIETTIKSAAKEMGQAASKEFSLLIDEILKNRLKQLDQSLCNAKEVLNETMGEKYFKLVFFSILGCCLFGIAGFGIGYAYSKKNTYTLPHNFMEIYNMGAEAKLHSLEKYLQKKNNKVGTKQ